MTVWDVFWFLFLFIPLCILWVIVLLDVIRRTGLVGWQRAVWVMVIIFFPWIGVFAYLILRPEEAPLPSYTGRTAAAAGAAGAAGTMSAASTYSPQGSPAAHASSSPAAVPTPASPASPVSSDAQEATS